MDNIDKNKGIHIFLNDEYHKKLLELMKTFPYSSTESEFIKMVINVNCYSINKYPERINSTKKLIEECRINKFCH